MELEPEIMQQLLQIFASELESHAQLITDGLLKLEKDLEADARHAVLEDIFRSVHNIKGASRGVGILDLSEISHHLESLFGRLKRENAIPHPGLIDLSLECVDRMRAAHMAYCNKAPLDFDLNELILRIDDACNGTPPVPKKVTESRVSIGKKKITKKVRKKPVKKTSPAIEIGPDMAVVHPAVPGEKHGAGESAGAEIIHLSIDKLETVAASGEELQVSKIEMEDHLGSIHKLNLQLEALSRMWSHAIPSFRHHRKDLPVEMARLIEHSLDNIIELDNIGKKIHKEMRRSTSRRGILSNNIQGDIRMMRLVPVASLLRPMSRTVRDVARELGKIVEYEVIGDEIEMDRSVLDGVRDPLMHLLRNAIDHGLESPEQRSAVDKPETGKISVRVQAEGSQIRMSVRDDGNGIRVENIAAAARKRKIVTDAELASMSDEEILDLIFRPGFSSKDIVTNVSGRGVGLDVVRSNLRKLKGSVKLDTVPGQGTTFILNLPLTLATDHGLVVRVGSNIYAIPTTSVDRVMELDAQQIIDVEASQAVLVDGRAVPLCSLSSLLESGNNGTVSMELVPVVIVSKGWDIVALLVDEILGEREIVIKSLQPPLISVRNVTGGTLTGSGEIIMVLNPSNLVDAALKPGAISRVISTPDVSAEGVHNPHILVVDDSITTRTLEKNILEVAGYRVTTAVDGVSGWNAMQNHDFDLVVTDIEMPNMNGFELTDKIKQSEAYRDIPVIIVTSLASDDDQKRGIDVGANAYIVKGEFETHVLLDIVRQMV